MKNEYANRVREDIKSTPMEVLNRYMDNYIDDDYSLDRPYIGIVEDNDDPERLGRCRIRVYNVFDGIPVEDLPWAVPDFGFVGSNKSSFIVPVIGCIVSVYFDRGEIYLPRYTTKVLNVNQLPTNKDVDYPDTMVFFETDDGESFEINRKKQETTYTHSSGTKIKISADGTVDIDSVGELNVTHVKNLFVDGSTVTPEGTGPLCAIPSCLFTGAPHTGRTCLPSAGGTA